MILIVLLGVIIVALLVIIAAGVIYHKRRMASATDRNQNTEMREIGEDNTGSTTYASLIGKEPSTYASLTPGGRDTEVSSQNAGRVYESLDDYQKVNVETRTGSSQRNANEPEM